MSEQYVYSVEKILFVTNDFPPQSGGIQTFIEGLIYQLPKNSVVVHASSHHDFAAQEEYDQAIFDELGVVVVRDRQRILLPTLRLRNRIAGTIHAHSIKSVVFGASVPLGLLAPSLRKLGVLRFVALTHGHEVWWAKVPPFKWLLRWVAHHCDVVTHLGSFTKGAISKALRPEDRQKLSPLAPGVNVEIFHPGAKPPALITRYGLENKQVILCVGRLVQRKGQDVLIRAMAQLKDKYSEAQLLIAGAGNYESKLRRLALTQKVEDRITFVGRVPFADLPDLFRSADIFASPTRDRFGGLEVEGLGIVYLEASASGLPVIAGASGGSPDAVLSGETGLVVDGRDLDAIAQALDHLLGDASVRKSMGEHGRRWMESQWSWEIMGERFRRLLELN